MFGLPDNVLDKIREVVKKFENIKFVIFGSRARQTYKYNSDIDIAVLSNVDEQTKYKILDEFDKIDTAYKIDLVFIQNIDNDRFLNNIINEGKEL